mmetsp:Transcript_3766/g.3203  ORF Transcript_3766/g.3203 Transcript_3766/m.3203 type:complete len:282 (+) Transcript_3766:252-1097(+)
MWEQYSVIHYENIDEFLMNHACSFFNGEVRTLCNRFVDEVGMSLLVFLYNSTSPDEACRKIKACSNPQCNLVYPGQFPHLKFSENFETVRQFSGAENFFDAEYLSASFNEESKSNIWKNLIKDIEDFFARFAVAHKPDLDFDHDSFSAEMGPARGFHWRGRDCNDLNPNVYPGRKIPARAKYSDYNCNGISGKNPETGNTYKQDFCDNTNQLGFAVIGDSAGAHFEIPPEYLNASQWKKDTFNELIPKLLDEFDIPSRSAWSGYEEDTPEVPVRSIYKYMT